MRFRARAVLALAIATTPLQAVAGPHDAAIAEIMDRAEADLSVLLSCSVLDPRLHERAVGILEDEWSRLRPLLVQADVAVDMIEAFGEQLSLGRVMQPASGDLASLIAFCGARSDWMVQFSLLRMAIPSVEVRRLLNP